jgi:Flp pilus assembly protein TadD
MRRFQLCVRPCATLLLFVVFHAPGARADKGPHWIRVNSGHFSILTDAGQKDGAAAILRLEQMRAAFGQLLLKNKLVMSEPLDVIAFKTTEEYAAVAPAPAGRSLSSGAFIPGDDRNYLLLDLSDSNPWPPVSRGLARVLLRYNYPQTPAWFDEGLSAYFSSLRVENDTVLLGSDPASFTTLLNSETWLPIQELFAQRSSSAQSALFRAQSWIVVHYLMTTNKLPETGAYFGLVENQKLAVEQAVQQAYGVSVEQFGQAIKDHFHSLGAKQTAGDQAASGMQQFPALTPTEIGNSIQEVRATEARALLAEAALRQPEHRPAAEKDLEAMAADQITDNSVVHRALGWLSLQNKEYPQAMEELAKASERNPADPWPRYYLALAKYRAGQEGAREFPGLANMMQDLRAATDWDPEFAEAYNMLAMARLQGGGNYSALDAIRIAIQLSPRDQTYLLHLVQIYLAAKKWDDAESLLHRLQSSPDARVAAAARQDLEDLPTLKKYGILPQRSASAPQPAAVWSSTSDEDEASAEAAVPPRPAPDRRKTEYLQGRLLAVDCSVAPAAVVTVSAHGKTRRFRTEDYKSLTLIGAEEFSCAWKNRPVVINYKAGGKTSGDLVSLEIQ